MSIVRLLHISDLHYSRRKHQDQSIVLNALFKDVRYLVSSGQKPDLVIFSGDMVNDPDEENVYADALNKFVYPLLEACALTEDRFIVVPGNHDVRRSVIETQQEHINTVISKLSARNAINDYYIQNIQSLLLRERLSNFFDFRDLFAPVSRIYHDLFLEAHYISSINIGIVCVNTAWASTADSSRDDRRLLIPEASLVAATRRLPSDIPLVLVGHHPLDELAQENRNDVMSWVESSFLLYLFGHVHNARPVLQIGPNGKVLLAQSGALFQTRDHFNGYSFLSVDTENSHAEFRLRTYFDGRREFDEAVDIAKNGRFYSSKEAEVFWAEAPKELNTIKLTGWIEDLVRPHMLNYLDEGLADRPISELFVEPRLSRQSQFIFSPEEDQRAEELATFDEITCGDDNLLILGDPESGKTTLIKQLARLYITDFCNTSRQRVPTIVNFEDIKDSIDRIQREVRKALPDLANMPFSITDLLKAGSVVLLIDDFDPNERRKTRVLFEFMRTYPRNRFIITAKRDLLSDVVAESRLEAPVPITSLFLTRPSRGDLRKLLSKWQIKEPINVETVLDRLVQTIVYINLPITTTNATILLSIFDDDADFRPINQATLIERFVEILLEKQSISDTLRSSFDYRNKEDFLMQFAQRMVHGERYKLSYDEAIGFAREYLSRHGFRGDPREVIDSFVDARIFSYHSELVSFRYRAFLEFFVARKIADDRRFYEFILHEERYLSYVNEIEYFAALRRNDRELLEMVGRRFDELDGKISEELGWKRELGDIEHLEISANASLSDMIHEIESGINAPRISDDERDALLDAELPYNIGDEQDVYRPLYSDLGQRWTAALILYSAIVRSTELVEDSAKRAHLSKVLAGWGKLTLHSLLHVPSLVKNRRMVIGGVTYEIFFPRTMKDDEIARRVYFGLPRGISGLVKTYLGSEKLERQLSEDSLSQSQEEGLVKFLRRSLYCDLRLPGFIEQFKQLEEDLRGMRFLYEAFAWKGWEMIAKFALSNQEYNDIVRVVSTAVGRLAPGDPTERRQARVGEYERLKRIRVLRTLRAQGRGTDEKG